MFPGTSINPARSLGAAVFGDLHQQSTPEDEDNRKSSRQKFISHVEKKKQKLLSQLDRSILPTRKIFLGGNFPHNKKY